MVYNVKDDMILYGVDNINLFDEFSTNVSLAVDIFKDLEHNFKR